MWSIELSCKKLGISRLLYVGSEVPLVAFGVEGLGFQYSQLATAR